MRHIRKYNAAFDRLKTKFLAQPAIIQDELCIYFDTIIETLPPESRLRSSLSGLCTAVKIASWGGIYED